MLAQVNFTKEEFASITLAFPLAFPTKEITSIKIPEIYKEAVNNPKYGKQ